MSTPKSKEAEGPSKRINQFRFSLLDQILRNQTVGGGVTTGCGLIITVILFAVVPESASSTALTMCGALGIVVGIFGLSTLTGALRIAKIIEDAPEIDGDAVKVHKAEVKDEDPNHTKKE